MKKLLLVILLVWSTAATASIIPSDTKKTVYFIFVKNEKGEITPNGTGFLVSVNGQKNPNRIFGYLVTAKHVLYDPSGKVYPSIFIRLNTKSKQAEMIELKLQGQKIYTHPDPSVDIGVIPAWPDEKKFDFKVIPSNLLMSKEIFSQEQISEGDEVFIVSLFSYYYGDRMNIPLTRFGRVAMITDEKIHWEGKLTDLYLVEAQTFSGNSGAPVFFHLTQSREASLAPEASRVFLAGILQGTFFDAQQIQVTESARTSTMLSIQNNGISAVVPAYKLLEILLGAELTQIRNKAEL